MSSSAPEPSTARLVVDVSHLRAAWDAAARSSESSHTCWTRLTSSLEGGHDVDEVRRELDRALAAQAYAWAVYRCAVDEVRSARD